MKTCEIMIRNVPVEVRHAILIIAAQQARPLQELLVEIIVKYIAEVKGGEP